MKRRSLLQMLFGVAASIIPTSILRAKEHSRTMTYGAEVLLHGGIEEVKVQSYGVNTDVFEKASKVMERTREEIQALGLDAALISVMKDGRTVTYEWGKEYENIEAHHGWWRQYLAEREKAGI